MQQIHPPLAGQPLPPPPAQHPQSAPQPAQFQPGVTLYSEPLYAYPQQLNNSNGVTKPGNAAAGSSAASSLRGVPMSLYGTLPRRPPRPVDPQLLNARSLGNYATFRQNSNSSATSLSTKNTARRRIRWSQEDLLLATPPGGRRKLDFVNDLNRAEEEEDEDDQEEAETTLEEEEDTSTASPGSTSGSSHASSASSSQDAEELAKSPPLPPRRPPRHADVRPTPNVLQSRPLPVTPRPPARTPSPPAAASHSTGTNTATHMPTIQIKSPSSRKAVQRPTAVSRK